MVLLANRIEAFASLGQLVREFQEQSQEQSITDPDTLAYVTGVIRSMISGRNLSVVGVTVDGDTFKGEARVKVNPRLTKRFSFAIAPDSKTFQPLNADEIEKFAEPVEFRAAGGKTLKCKIEQCGGRCLKGGEKCRLGMKPEERKAHEVALRKVGTVDTSLAKKRREMKARREKAAADELRKATEERDAQNKAIPDKALQKARSKKEVIAPQKQRDAKNSATKKIDKTKSERQTKNPATPKSKVHSVTKQQDFDDLVMHTYGKLAKKHDGLVPIHELRREIGELVPRDKFKSYLIEMQANDKLRLMGGEMIGATSSKMQDSIETPGGGMRFYAKLSDKGEAALAKASKRSKELDELLKGRPELDPLGTASQLSKGEKIKTRSDFDKVALEAHKRLDDEFNHGNLVPIADVRKALGDRVSKKDFDDYLFDLQSNDKIQLIGSDKAPKELTEGGVDSAFGGKRVYMRKL
jgi:hypothetical protein